MSKLDFTARKAVRKGKDVWYPIVNGREPSSATFCFRSEKGALRAAESLAKALKKRENAAYLTHAANAYPQLIEALRGIANDVSADFGDCPLGKVRALLAELGEE